MDLASNNLQRLICHKTQPTNHLISERRPDLELIKKREFADLRTLLSRLTPE